MGATVSPGIDVLLAERPELVRGARVGLVTNHTGVDARATSSVDRLFGAAGVQLVALFGPEHGIRGNAADGALLDSSRDAQTGLPVYSLYGETFRPTSAMLAEVDVLVFDIQDVGSRTYTYASTLLEVLRGADGRRVVVLDRPNPITGTAVQGNVLDMRFATFVGAGPVALRHGMTMGELALFFNGDLEVGADVQVVPAIGWRRDMWFDETGLPWLNPSPNIRSLRAAVVYPGTVLVEGTNLSEGRGTEAPFETIGAPWLAASLLAERLNRLSMAGVHFSPTRFTPSATKFANQACEGVSIHVTDRSTIDACTIGMAIVATAHTLAPSDFAFRIEHFDRLCGTDQVRAALTAGASAHEIAQSWSAELACFAKTRAKYLLY